MFRKVYERVFVASAMIAALGIFLGVALIRTRNSSILAVDRSVAAYAPHNVLTQKYDNLRTGATLTETILTPANVNVNQFGLLMTLPVDGGVYAQPLYVANVSFPDKSVHSVIYVATMHNSLYAFDADTGASLWTENVGHSVPVQDYSDFWQYPFTDIADEVGILSTPVIDLPSQTLYFVAATKIGKVFEHKLHAVDIVTGDERPGSPVVIAGSVPGTGGGSQNGILSFASFNHLQRVSLAFSNGNIIFATGAHGDLEPYHGWLFAYDATTLKQTGIFATCPDSDGCGFWESGQGPSIDENGDIYMATGNGFSADPAQRNGYTNSIIRFKLNASGFMVADSFTPANWSWLDANDYDLGVSGTLLIPSTNLVLGGSKIGSIYNLTRDNLGGLSDNDVKVHQEFQASAWHIHAAPVYWNKAVYVWSENDFLKAYALNGDMLDEAPVMSSTFMDVMDSMPGGMLAISANGNQVSTGVLWANLVLSGDANLETRPGILRAFDASDLKHELWNSQMNAPRDSFGNFAKFTIPTIANGKVYLATFSNQIAVYGLLPLTEGVKK